MTETATTKEAAGTRPPKISVIVPVYKVEKYLPECIESILAQTFTDFELILVDDGSPDNSGKICDAYAARDSRIRVFHKENGGVSSARNFGMKNSLGEWIALLDGDDHWLPKHLANIVRGTSLFPQSKVFYTGYTNDRTNNFSPIRKEFAFEVRDYWALALNGNGIWTSCVCFHASVPKEIPMFRLDLTHGEDLDVWRGLVRVYQVVMIPEITAIYRICSENSAVSRLPVPEKTIIWDLDFSSIGDEKESLYFKRIYYGFLFRYFPFSLRHFWTLASQKRFWGVLGFFKFVFELNWIRVKRTLNRVMIRESKG